MSVNTSHVGDGVGVILFNGECNILYVTGVTLKLTYLIQHNYVLQAGYYLGGLYLTTHRLIFINKDVKSNLLSLNMPHVFLHNVKKRKPPEKFEMIEMEIEAEPNGGFHGRLPITLIFPEGGSEELYISLASLGLRSCQAARYWKPGTLFKSHFPNSPLYHAPAKTYLDVFKDPQFKFVNDHITFKKPTDNQIYMHKILVPYPGFFDCISTPDSLNLAVPLEPDPRGLSKAYRNPTIWNTYWTPCSKMKYKEGIVCKEESEFCDHPQHYQGPYYSGPTHNKVSGECECKELKWEVPEHCKCKAPCDPCLETGCIPYLCDDKFLMIKMCRSDRPCHSNVYNKCE